MEDLEDIRARIEEQYEFIQDANYYEILGVDRSATKDEMTSRFRDLAKKWHVDSFSEYDLDGETREKLQKISTEVNNAYQTLSNPEERKEYNAVLETENTDIGSVIDAENNFRKGRNLLDAGRYEGAHEQFEKAYELSPEEEPEYRAYYLYTEYLLLPKHKDGTPRDRDRAIEIFEELEQIVRDLPKEKAELFSFLGTIAQALGRTTEAEGLFLEARRIDPEDRLAKRQLRLIEKRKDEDEDEGLWNKILSALNLN